MKKLNKIAVGLTALIMGLCGNAMAAEQIGTAQVNASVAHSCEMNMVELEDFNINYTPLNPHPGTNRFISVLCTKTTPYEIGVSVGHGGSESTRVMKNGNNSLIYTLNVENNEILTVWGDIGSANTFKGLGNGVYQMVQVNFQVPGGQYVAQGTYTDELVVTFNY